MQKGIRLSIIALLLWLYFFSSLQAGDVEISSAVNRDNVTIGDEVSYILTVKGKPEIKLDSLGLNLSPFKIKEKKSYPSQKDKAGNLIQKEEYVITIFELGSFVIPPAKIKYIDTENQVKEATSDSIAIKVSSIGMPQDAKDIKGLKPPFVIKEKSRWYLYLIPALVALAILGWLYLRWRGKGIGLPLSPPEPEKPAWEIALTELRKLKDSDYIQKNQIKKYYIILSEIMRKYLEKRFNIFAMDRTTLEIKSEMRRVKADKQVIQRAVDLLSDCDLVKFAKYVPSFEKIEKDWQDSYDLIENTKIVEIETTVATK
ncbi:MAG: BatD family protein [candidate division Zixibacteria bacterium]|nr:BatD family protein [candidate division Zixibacteria bacterium]